MTSSRDTFLAELRRGMKRCQAGSKLLIGLSGGADSVALFRGLLELQPELEFSVHVAHLNHQLRGAASDVDTQWVDALCKSFAVPSTIGTASIGVTGTGIEEAARKARHRFLDDVARSSGADTVITAHTADDQLETVLHHLFRGTGLAGLRGIPLVRSTESGCRLIRPMLSIRRSLIESYLSEIGQDFRTDATNTDTEFTRNWLRHNMLPQLRTQFGDRVDSSVLRLVEQAGEIEQTIEELAGRLLDQAILDAQTDSVRLNTRIMADQPVHLVRELFHLVWRRQQWPRQGMGYSEWNRLAELARKGGNADFPGGIRARHSTAGLLVLEKTDR
ncbi:MAG: tRNA lysidine(34) synthetase TilS [Planctomycetaceae bacterium]